MNCPRCQAPADPGARICLHCGTILQEGGAAWADGERTVSAGPTQQQPLVLPAWPEAGQAANVRSETPTIAGRVVHPGAVRQLASTAERPRRRRRRWLAGCLVTLLLIPALLASGWFFLVRPMLNTIARQQLNNALDAAVQQINPAQAALLPGGPVYLSETLLNNLLVLAHSPSSALQNAHFTITPAAITLDFTLYGFGCSISGVPQVTNYQLSMRDLHAQGIIALILSDEDIQTIINQHLVEAQQHLHHVILAVTLQEHEIELTLSQPEAAGAGAAAFRARPPQLYTAATPRLAADHWD